MATIKEGEGKKKHLTEVKCLIFSGPTWNRTRHLLIMSHVKMAFFTVFLFFLMYF